jgi:phospholipid/cholesterol/gamma-HCH transport system permease protein
MNLILAYINNSLKFIVLEIQEFSLFIARAVSGFTRKPRYWQDLFDYMDIDGVGSIPIVLIAGGCSGALMATEVLYQLRSYGADMLLGRVTGISIVRGAGPVLTAIIVSSRVCPAAAAELGSMQVSQQIDALVTMGIDPYRKLVTPRILAGILMFPGLAIVNGTIAIFAGALVAQLTNAMTFTFFLNQSLSAIALGDVLWGLIKSTVFGLIVVSTACYHGMRVSGGTTGVRRGATLAAVGGILSILIADFVMTSLAHIF